MSRRATGASTRLRPGALPVRSLVAPTCPRSDAAEVVELHVVALDVVGLLASAATRQRWLFTAAGVRALVHRHGLARERLEAPGASWLEAAFCPRSGHRSHVDAVTAMEAL